MDKYFKAEQFHNRYIQLYEHFVVVTLIDGTTLEGLYNDDFLWRRGNINKSYKKKCKAGRKIHGSIFEYISSIDFLSYTGHINFIGTGTF